jgi:hypothetical protein
MLTPAAITAEAIVVQFTRSASIIGTTIEGYR